MLGGLPTGHRALFTTGDFGAFEQAVEQALGERLRASVDDANAFWGALANVDWVHDSGVIEVGYSFRAAGDLIAAIRKDEGTMTYMNYYCNGEAGVVPEWVEEALKLHGWAPRVAENG